MKRLASLGFAALSALLIASPVAAAGFHAIADSYVDSGDPATPYGASTRVHVRLGSGPRVGLVKFDLSTIPAGTIVVNARLNYWLASVAAPGSLRIKRVLGPWEETVTASTAPIVNPTDFANFHITAAMVGRKRSVDLTDLVQAWVAGTFANHGLALLPDSTLRATFAAREDIVIEQPFELEIELLPACSS